MSTCGFIASKSHSSYLIALAIGCLGLEAQDFSQYHQSCCTCDKDHKQAIKDNLKEAFIVT
jgi:hypothetical protein